ncbi:hypothetical protein EX30DRAFT_394251 [Ascodesmis nigricans]|uniref:Uncharacterized protein n=1 Tax=Ascodesmis nigricans TaxID=341454 RepID=A0A4S2N1P2_9PEZI|nr:hypothetical protein EX30DRAFT_394251 [Ascodesmis nigricans]
MLTTSSQATRESFSSVPKPSTKTAENAPVSIQDKRDEIPDIKNDNVETTTETPAVPIVNPTKRKRSLSRPTSQRKRVDVDTSCRSEKGDKFTDIMKGKPGVGESMVEKTQRPKDLDASYKTSPKAVSSLIGKDSVHPTVESQPPTSSSESDTASVNNPPIESQRPRTRPSITPPPLVTPLSNPSKRRRASSSATKHPKGSTSIDLLSPIREESPSKHYDPTRTSSPLARTRTGKVEKTHSRTQSRQSSRSRSSSQSNTGHKPLGLRTYDGEGFLDRIRSGRSRSKSNLITGSNTTSKRTSNKSDSENLDTIDATRGRSRERKSSILRSSSNISNLQRQKKASSSSPRVRSLCSSLGVPATVDTFITWGRETAKSKPDLGGRWRTGPTVEIVVDEDHTQHPPESDVQMYDDKKKYTELWSQIVARLEGKKTLESVEGESNGSLREHRVSPPVDHEERAFLERRWSSSARSMQASELEKGKESLENAENSNGDSQACQSWEETKDYSSQHSEKPSHQRILIPKSDGYHGNSSQEVSGNNVQNFGSPVDAAAYNDCLHLRKIGALAVSSIKTICNSLGLTATHTPSPTPEASAAAPIPTPVPQAPPTPPPPRISFPPINPFPLSLTGKSGIPNTPDPFKYPVDLIIKAQAEYFKQKAAWDRQCFEDEKKANLAGRRFYKGLNFSYDPMGVPYDREGNRVEEYTEEEAAEIVENWGVNRRNPGNWEESPPERARNVFEDMREKEKTMMANNATKSSESSSSIKPQSTTHGTALPLKPPANPAPYKPFLTKSGKPPLILPPGVTRPKEQQPELHEFPPERIRIWEVYNQKIKQEEEARRRWEEEWRRMEEEERGAKEEPLRALGKAYEAMEDIPGGWRC